MTAPGSVTLWIHQLRAGDRTVVAPLWERYFQRLVGLAQQHMARGPKGVADGEDVASEAFVSFCLRAEAGQFPDLTDRDELWSLLACIAARKVARLFKRESQARRDWRLTKQLCDNRDAEHEQMGDLLTGVASGDPDPAFAAEMADQCRHLLGLLDMPGVQNIAVRKLEGHTNQEIASQTGCSVPTIERRLKLIRATWAAELPPEPPATTDG